MRHKTKPASTAVTERQARVLRFIEQYIHQHGYPPSLREIADALGMTPAGAHYHVQKLRKKNLLTYQPHRIRTIALVKSKRR
jgi:repressor LexA